MKFRKREFLLSTLGFEFLMPSILAFNIYWLPRLSCNFYFSLKLHLFSEGNLPLLGEKVGSVKLSEEDVTSLCFGKHENLFCSSADSVFEIDLRNMKSSGRSWKLGREEINFIALNSNGCRNRSLNFLFANYRILFITDGSRSYSRPKYSSRTP